MVDIGIGLPLLSFTVKVMVGFWPALPLVTFCSTTLTPGTCTEFSGITCAPSIDASNSPPSFGKWHWAHWVSLAWGSPPAWFLPEAKFTSLWQEPQAARLGLVSQLDACVAPVVDSWQNWQRRGSEGSITEDQSVDPS